MMDTRIATFVDCIWFELTPGERTEEPFYPDEAAMRTWERLRTIPHGSRTSP
jgi:hypothetical protein